MDYRGGKIEEIQDNLHGIIDLLEKSKKWETWQHILP
jgi:hypothetical protein